MRFGAELSGVGDWRRIRRWAVPIVGVLVALGAIAWFTPMLAVREVRIEGVSAVPEEQVRELLAIPDGLSILRIDTAAMATRVSEIPKVRSVRVRRSLPATVQVTVQERTPVLYYGDPQEAHLLDADGVEYAIESAPIGVPRLRTEHPGMDDPLTRAAVEVATALPPALEIQVDEVIARSLSDISLTLRDGRAVLWGSSADAERKSAVVMPLLTREGTVFDVSSPSLVTVR
ncbi:cell division protein FtsQ/DivIB [Nocardia paucivorans]|uniref:cell division protein FtsQ/DivIB n=1 Tax=Nocardia paucivorans TaxID=114259 RepID=UPI000301B0C8|nr:FtsQ-type POTRA domain-containing protein [Nocardia paucivorans]